MKILRSILIVAVIVVIIALAFPRKSPSTVTPEPVATENESIKGCYVATLSKDVYTLRIESYSAGMASGILEYKNFEKDSSKGVIEAGYTNGILLGDYTFNSEGMSSVRQVLFKKVANGFVQGFGPVTTKGNREEFSDLTKISYDNSPVFVSTTCNN